MPTSSISRTRLSAWISIRQPVAATQVGRFWTLLADRRLSLSWNDQLSIIIGFGINHDARHFCRTIAFADEPAGSSLGTMSIFSPRSSWTQPAHAQASIPTQAPTGSTSRSRLLTAILLREPGSRADDSMHDLFVDLADFLLKQLLEQTFRGPRQHDLRSRARFLRCRRRRP